MPLFRSFRHFVSHFPWLAFLCLLMVLYFGHWLGAAALEQVDSATDKWPHHHPWITAATSGLLLTLAAMILHSIHHSKKRRRHPLEKILLWALSTLTVVLAFCGATWAEHAVLTVDLLKEHPVVFAGICIVGLFVVNRVLRDILRGIEGPQNIELTGYPDDPPKTLILFVSIINSNTLELGDAGPFAAVKTGPPNIPPTTYELAGHSLGADIKALDGSRWPWQQLMRAIEPHQSLDKIILIGSKNGLKIGSPGSFNLLPECCRLLGQYLPKGCEINQYPDALPFEDFNAVKGTLRKLILNEIKRVGEGAVFIDVTGGQTTNSIAAAAATIGTEAIFQYVQTNEPFDVLYYDVRNAHAPDLHGHS